MNLVAVFIGGGIGSLCRYGMSVLLINNKGSHFPLATFLSNLLACIILALILVFLKDKIQHFPFLAPLLITGFCGGFSTFSTFSLETMELLNTGNYTWAILNVLVSVALGIGVLWFFKSLA